MNYVHLAELLALGCVGLSATSIGLTIAFVRARGRAMRAEGILEGRQSQPTQADRFTPTLEAIAIEVERIGEAQRFLTRVLSERATDRDLATKRPLGSITPH